MANNFDYAYIWARRMQEKLEKMDVFRAIANWEGQDQLKHGSRFYKPYRSAVVTQTYTPGTAFTVQTLTDTTEYLEVATRRVAPFYLDDMEAVQSSYKLQDEYGEDCIVQLNNWLDGSVLGEYENVYSGNTVDDGDVTSGGTAGTGFTMTTANVQKAFTTGLQKLLKNNVKATSLFGVINPNVYQLLLEYLAGKDTGLGDTVGTNGYVGRYMGFDIYVSNATAGSARLMMGTQPTDADTVTIDGVTFTFETGTRDVAGEVYSQTSGAVSIDNLVKCIDLSGTSGTEYYPLSTANQGIADRWTCTDGTSYLDIVAEGCGVLVVSETLTATADVWTPSKQVAHMLLGQKGATHVITQKQPSINIRPVSDKIGVNVAPHLLFGVKTFYENTKKIVDMQVRSDTW